MTSQCLHRGGKSLRMMQSSFFRMKVIQTKYEPGAPAVLSSLLIGSGLSRQCQILLPRKKIRPIGNLVLELRLLLIKDDLWIGD